MSTTTDATVLIVGAPGSGKGSVLGSQPVGTVRQMLKRVDRAINIGERELRYQLDRKHDHSLANSTELLFVLAELEELGLVQAELCFRLTDHGRRLMTEPQPQTDGEVRFAAMEDDTVLCVDCVEEIRQHDPVQAQRAEAVVHAWIDPGPGVCCRWCGATATLDEHGEGATS
jgi:hypothetical protein